MSDPALDNQHSKCFLFFVLISLRETLKYILIANKIAKTQGDTQLNPPFTPPGETTGIPSDPGIYRQGSSCQCDQFKETVG